MSKSFRTVVLLAALFLGAVAVVWFIRSRDAAQKAAAPPAAAAPADAGTQANAGAATTAAGQQGQAQRTAAPLVLPATVPADAAALIEQLSRFNAGDAQRELIALGRSRVPDLLAALRDITSRQNALPAGQRAELERLEKQKLQLYPVIAQLAGPEAAPLLIETALASRRDSFAFDRTSNTLDAIGASADADRFAVDLATRSDASKSMLYAAFTRFAFRPAPPEVLEAATRWVGPQQDYRIRNAALRLIASSTQPAQVPAAFRALLADPRTVDFTVMSALADAVQPPQFASLTLDAKLDADYLRKSTAFNAFRWASDQTRTELAPHMLVSDLPEIQAAGLKHLLETGNAAALASQGVAGPVGEPRELFVRPDFKVMIARLGFSLSLAGDAIVIGRVGP